MSLNRFLSFYSTLLDAARLSFYSTQLDAARFYQAARSPYLMIRHFRWSVCYKTFLMVRADQLSFRSLSMNSLFDGFSPWPLLDCLASRWLDARWPAQWPFSMGLPLRCALVSRFDDRSPCARLTVAFFVRCASCATFSLIER